MSAPIDIQQLPLDRLFPHPDNPRLQLREDVVERLAAEITRTGFRPEHAILARPHESGWQIVSGHHRLEAASRAGLTEIPAWVREMDDDEAFMQLVLGNTQGELSPLEIGMHALKAVPLAEGGRGKRGGLTEYAERVGTAQGTISKWRAAADVVETHSCGMGLDLSDRVGHLYEISKSPRETWSLMVDRLVSKGWTVADTKATVEKVRQFDIPSDHGEWLPLADVVSRFLSSGKPSPAAVSQLISAAEAVVDACKNNEHSNDGDAADFEKWLIESRGKDSWDRRKVGDYHVMLIRQWAERAAEAAAAAATEAELEEPKLPDGVDIRLGDFREVLDDLADNSVDVIITDPPYPAEFLSLLGRRAIGRDEYGGAVYDEFEAEGLSELAQRVLKPGGICAVMIGQSYLPEVIERLGAKLNYHWTLTYLTPGGQATQLWQRKVNTFWKPILIYTKGEYNGPWLGDVTKSEVNDNDKRHHHWGQSESGMADLIDRLSQPGQLICDPFLGGGTTAVVAHDLGRRFVGCDVSEECVATTTERFAKEREA